jgi:hypothetical protein
MILHYGVTHAPLVLLAGISLLVFAAGLLLGSRLGDDGAAPDPDADVEH